MALRYAGLVMAGVDDTVPPGFVAVGLVTRLVKVVPTGAEKPARRGFSSVAQVAER
jgi:hypothetical protein